MQSVTVASDVGFEDLIFVGGAPRSGTTLVQNILDSHPHVYGGPEFTVLPDIIRLRTRIGDEIDRGNLRPYGTRRDLDRCMRKMVVDFLGPPAQRLGVRRISEKSPGNCLVFTELLSLFPNSRAVHVVRDPVDTFLSMKTVRERHIDRGVPLPPMLMSDESIGSTISEFFEAGHSAFLRQSDKIVEVRYEDLIAAPEPTVAKICESVGLEFFPSMLQPAEHRHDTDYIIDKFTPWYAPEQYYRPIENNSRQTRRRLLQRESSALRNAFAGMAEVVRGLGYGGDWIF